MSINSNRLLQLRRRYAVSECRGGVASGVSAAMRPMATAAILPPFRMLLNMVILSLGYKYLSSIFMPDLKNLLRNIAKRAQQGGSPFAITCRKVRPIIIWPNSGMHFPAEAPSGNYDPEFRPRTGCGFPNRAQPETVTQFGASKRDAVSAWSTLAAIPPFSGRHQQSRSQKIYEQMFDTHTSTCVFSVEKLCYSKNSIASRLFLPNGRYLINY